MIEFILICIVVFLFMYGYFVMRKMDRFLAENNSMAKEYNSSSLRIAFETFDLAQQSAELIERFSEKNPSCEILLFYGSAEKIEKGLKNKELDFGFMTGTCHHHFGEDFDSLCVAVKERPIIYNSTGLTILPLGESEQDVKILWTSDEESQKKKIFIELVYSYFK